MKKVFVALLILGLAISCVDDVESNEKQRSSSHESNVPSDKTKKEVIELMIDIEKENKLQEEVDKGHQPWRLEPIDVAYASVKSKFDDNINYQGCSLIWQSDKEAIVRCNSSTKKYLIHLKRLVKTNGIWTALSIEIER